MSKSTLKAMLYEHLLTLGEIEEWVLPEDPFDTTQWVPDRGTST
ncbi:hypothetical protein [Nocardia sp. NPDC049149]